MRNASKFLTIVAAAGLGVASLTLSSANAQQPTPQPSAQPAPQPAKPAPAKPARPLFDVGMPAPGFTLLNTEGKPVRLADSLDKIVVIEWLNPGCDEARFLHTSGPIPAMLKAYEHDDVVWLAINAVPKTDKFGGIEASVKAQKELNITYPVLIDENGLTAKMYEVTRSPSVTVIDAKGVVRYIGAVDNAPNGKLPEGAKHINYLDQTLRALIDGTNVQPTRTPPGGCELRPAPAKTN